MITVEQLSQNPALSALTDEQRTVITTMSANDEASVIAQKTSEIYAGLDADIKASTGVERNGDEKTYDYLKRASGILKARSDKASGMETELTTLKAECDSLKEQITKGGGDADAAAKLTELNTKYTQLKKDHSDLKASITDMQKNHETTLHTYKVEAEIETALSGFAYKKEIPATAVNALVKDAVEKLKSGKSEFIDDGKGGKRLAYRNEAGEIMNNAENSLAPFTTSELLKRDLADIIDTGRTVTGGGAEPPANGGGGPKPTMDLSGVNSRTKATEIISSALGAAGLLKGTEEYQDKFDEAWEANGVSDMPLE